MTCIYCKGDLETFNAEEHVFPASIGGNKTLPKGYVCDGCNNYFAELDTAVLMNRYIAMDVGALEIPGRGGKPRQRIGERLEFSQGGKISLKMGPIKIRSGAVSATFQPTQSKEFNELRFARGIHKIAFNAFAFYFGKRRALSEKFNQV